uniref:Uncharacterized protein n=1 Tax=Caenorhabditis japonica TaxID=281687 RepID=A0A8R1DX03_CAEJA
MRFQFPFLLLHVAVLLSLCLVQPLSSQFYHGDLEPRYSRKTPFRQQTEIPEPVFGIGHVPRRFGGDPESEKDKSGEDHYPFFEKRQEPGGRNSGAPGGRDSEESGDEFERPHLFRRGGGGFKRPTLPDPEEVKERFDVERERPEKSNNDGPEYDGHDNKKSQRFSKPKNRYDEDNEKEQETDQEEEDKNEARDEGRRKGEHQRKDEDREPENHRNWEEEPEDKKPSKVVGLNMQMVAGVYPKDKHGPEIEDVEKRGNKFFRGPGPDSRGPRFRPRDRDNERHRSRDKGSREEEGSGSSGELERRNHNPRNDDKRHEEPSEEQKQPGRRPERPERPNESEGGQQKQKQAPPPPTPQIPPFPPFPKFPGFGNYHPFQPHFGQFGGNGGFAGGPWHPSGGSAERPAAPREDASSGEDRRGADRRRVHQPDASTAPSDDTRARDGSAERRDPAARDSKEDARGREAEPRAEREPERGAERSAERGVERKVEQETERGAERKTEREPKRGAEREREAEPEHDRDEERGEEREPKREPEHYDQRPLHKSTESRDNQPETNINLPKPQLNMKSSEQSHADREFPTPGRFVANIRAKKSGDLEITTQPPTTPIPTTTTTTPPALTTAHIEMLKTFEGVVLPTESILPKMRTMIIQKIKVA